MPKTTIKELLRGVTPGQVQTVGNMTVIPLISDVLEPRILPPEGAEIGTENYGSLMVQPKPHPDKDAAVAMPLGAGYIVSQAAQNHATTGAALVKPGKVRTIRTAACIQESQGGTIRRAEHDMMIIPQALREAAFDKRSTQKYSKLWDDIRGFNQSAGLRGRGHLEDFFGHYEKELQEFVAEFEVVKNQVGAIVLVGDQVLGIERAPNYEYWKFVWKPLIRDCYGSVALQVAQATGMKAPKIRVPLKSKARTIGGLKKALKKADDDQQANAKALIENFIKESFTPTKETGEKVGAFSIESFQNKQFKGQMIRDGEIPVYLSAITTHAWLSDPKLQAYENSEEFQL